MNTYHIPILVDEIVTGLRVEKGKKYIDATVGGGGHALEIVKHGGILLGIDADRDAIEYAKERLKNFGNWTIVQGNFRDIEKIAHREGFGGADGVLFDLGVSSHQLDDPAKGFTYREDDSRLDMRFDPTMGEPASGVIKRCSENELYEIFSTLGEEEHSRAIAHALVGTRSINSPETAGAIRRVVERVVGEGMTNKVLSRIFQALRMYVNDERGALQFGLEGAKNLLNIHGRVAVLSFHSIEDRIVKQNFLQPGWRIVVKKPVRASIEEQTVNRRSRSAKLRIAEKL
jgi:16S rRNA (cytosine1402-N4)-methyltransferase